MATTCLCSVAWPITCRFASALAKLLLWELSWYASKSCWIHHFDTNIWLIQKEQNIITTATDVKELADIFNQVHSIEANTNILALIAANMANNGTHVLNKNNLTQAQAVQETLSFMDACGLNNDSKDW